MKVNNFHINRPLVYTTLPQDVEVPDSLRDYEGFYTSINSIRKVEISPDKKGMTFSAYDGEGFKPAGTITYKENGRFYRPDGVNYSFAEYGDGKVIIAHFDSSDIGIVQYEKLNNIQYLGIA